MTVQAIPWTVPMLLAAVVSAVAAALVARYRDAPGAVPLAVLLAAAALWGAAAAFQRASPTLPGKLFWIRVQYLGIAIVPTTWLVFVLRYTGRDRWVTRRTLALLAIKPMVMVALVLTNGAHGLFWSGFGLERVDGFVLSTSTYAVGFWVHVGYDYLLLAIGTALLIGLFAFSDHVYRGQAGALLLASAVPWLANTANLTGVAPTGLDPTPIGFIASGVVLAVAIARTRLLDVVPIARSVGRNAFVENAPDAVVITDRYDRVADLNPAARRALDTGATDPIGRRLDEAFPKLAGALDEPGRGEFRVELDGERRWYDVRGSSLGRSGGPATGRLVTLRDVTDRKRQEANVVDLHDATRDLIRARDADVVAEVAVEAARDILGFPLAAIWRFDEEEAALVPVAETPNVREVLGEIPTYEPGEGLSWQVFESGEPRIYEDVRGVPEAYNPDTPVRSELILPLGEYGVMNVGSTAEETIEDIDVTLAKTLAAHTEAALERAEREAALRDERAFIESALDSLGDVFYVIDTDGEFVRWNEPATRVTGYSDEELATLDAADLFAGEDAVRVRTAMYETFETGSATVEANIVTVDGRTIPYEFRGERLTDGDGELLGIVGIGRDITDRRRRRQQIDVMGRLLRHNIRNEMNVIQAHAALIADDVDDPALAEYAREIDEIVEHVVRRSEKLGLVERDWTDPTPIDAAAAGSDAVAAARRVYPDARIETDLPNEARVDADPTVEVAIEELVTNALEHHPEPSAARVSVAVDPLEDRPMTRIEVADNGPGIPAMERRPIEAGEETPVDHASGIGLWVVAWSVHDVGGELEFDVDEDGSVVRLLIPTAERGAERAVEGNVPAGERG